MPGNCHVFCCLGVALDGVFEFFDASFFSPLDDADADADGGSHDNSLNDSKPFEIFIHIRRICCASLPLPGTVRRACQLVQHDASDG